MGKSLKRILYVDDYPSPYKPMVSSILEEFDLLIARSLKDGLQCLCEHHSAPIDGVLIDAYWPGQIPSELQEYGKNSPNKKPANGQLLGAWIRDRRLQIPYAYITLVPSIIVEAFEQAHPNYKGILPKSSSKILPRNINNTIRELFGF